jgi:hypothetical protein
MTTADTNAVDIYEHLRTAVLDADPEAGPNIGVLRRQGLTAWCRSLTAARDLDAPPADRPHHLSRRPTAAPPPSELTRLIASIILAITAEPAHV